MFYLKLRPMHILKEIFVEPDEIDVELFFDKESLIYAFYNNTRRGNFNVTARIADDEDEVYSKLRASEKDILLYKFSCGRLSKSPIPCNSTIRQEMLVR